MVVLDNVLYVLDFIFNLISVKLVSNNKYSVLFTKDYTFIQDFFIWKEISQAKAKFGLYFYDFILEDNDTSIHLNSFHELPFATSALDKLANMFDASLFRLSHPSFDLLKYVQQMDKLVTCNKFNYFVCPLAK